MLVGVGAALSGSRPLLDDIVELILHGRSVILTLNCLLGDGSFAERNLGGVALSVSNLDATLLCGSVSQLLYEAC